MEEIEKATTQEAMPISMYRTICG